MVALLVLFTIVGCLLADSIVLSVRERRAVAVTAGRKLAGAESLVFAQDGGKPVDGEKDPKTDSVEKES